MPDEKNPGAGKNPSRTSNHRRGKFGGRMGENPQELLAEPGILHGKSFSEAKQKTPKAGRFSGGKSKTLRTPPALGVTLQRVDSRKLGLY
ncbi:hypothetical protein JTB14_036971 [Gonioctena quinquepunctata]|nr:hypothetical protein JTB14_036971 [Gonioctena quinquepunctata]